MMTSIVSLGVVVWLELYEDNFRDWPKDYRFKYKRGREPDVLVKEIFPVFY